LEGVAVEAFEAFVALTLEAEGLVVSEAVKFPVTRPTAKASHTEVQTHGFEVDLVGASAAKLVLASVKSFFGSRGVYAAAVKGEAPKPADNRLYAMLNDPAVRQGILEGACTRYGYRPTQVEFRLYVGRFAGGSKGTEEQAIRDWCAATNIGGGAIKVYGVAEVAARARRVANAKQYRDNPALVAIKVLDAAGMLTPLPEQP
jgi:hypothetical protein